jgi:hypothetical protein
MDSMQKRRNSNITHHKESATVWDLKPEWWGSPLAQEEKYQGKENPWWVHNNNNNNIIIIIIIIMIGTGTIIIYAWTQLISNLQNHITPLWAVVTVTITRGKCISHKNHIAQSLYCALVALSIIFPNKMTRVLDSCHLTSKQTQLIHHEEEITAIQSDLNRSPQEWQNTHNYMSHALFLQYYVGTCQNKRVQKYL